MTKRYASYGLIVDCRDDRRAAFGEIPVGMNVPKPLWPFHRRLWYRYRLSLEYGEYKTICRSLDRGLAEQVCHRQNIWAVRIRETFIVLHVKVVMVNGVQKYNLRPIQPEYYERRHGGQWAPTEHLPEKYREKYVTPVAA